MSPALAAMTELAMSLRTLPHIDKISLGCLYNPRQRLMYLVQSVIYAQRLRVSVRKSHVRRRHESILQTQD